jgi:hypothetical protein
VKSKVLHSITPSEREFDGWFNAIDSCLLRWYQWKTQYLAISQFQVGKPDKEMPDEVLLSVRTSTPREELSQSQFRSMVCIVLLFVIDLVVLVNWGKPSKAIAGATTQDRTINKECVVPIMYDPKWRKWDKQRKNNDNRFRSRKRHAVPFNLE